MIKSSSTSSSTSTSKDKKLKFNKTSSVANSNSNSNSKNLFNNLSLDPTPPPIYLPNSYQSELSASNPAASKSNSITFQQHDLDAEGSLESGDDQQIPISTQTDQDQDSILIYKTDTNQNINSKSSSSSSSSPSNLKINLINSSPDKIQFKSKKNPKLKRRIAIESSDDDSNLVKDNSDNKVFKKTCSILSSPSDSNSDQIEILKPSISSLNKSKKRLLPFNSDSDSDSDSGNEITIINKSSKSSSLKLIKKSKSIKKLIQESDDDHQFQSDSDQDWVLNKFDKQQADEDKDTPAITEDEAIKFFNTCDVNDLPAVTACSLDQAKVIVSCRPFYNAEDMKKKLRKKKGVSSAVLDQYREMIKGYYEVDRVLTQCEKHGLKLSTIMNIWAGLDPADPSSSSTDDGAVELVEISKSTIQNDHQEAFKNYIHQQPSSIPPGITLKSYQLLGINWLNLLYSKRISCILADEMGLGKTAQVVCFLAHLKSKNNPGPHLVIVPSSTLENWKREFATFSPNLLVRSYYGSQTERAELRYELKSTSDLDVVITTYNIATGAADDRKFLDKMRFETCIYDEGHQLKNSESKRYKDLMRQKVGWRLLLTGTPLQNNLQELVSLLSFILPEIFQHAKDDLRTIFKVPSEAQANLLAQTRIMRAKKMMKPFVLRRKKQQVLKDLPKKIEQVVYCPMEQRQAEIYNEVMKRSKKHWMAMRDGLEPDGDDDLKEMENGLLGKNLKKKKKTGLKKSVLMTTCNVLMELRKAAIHPMLFRNLYDDQTIEKMSKACLNELAFCDRDAGLILEDMEVMTDFELHRFTSQYKHLKQFSLSEDECMLSGKVKVLEKLLKEIKDRGSRVLIFSQFTQVLSILERVMERFSVKFLILTGSTQVGERQGLVDQFTQDLSITAFLLSTKAGGLGLNLMAADTVIIFDQDFNPQNDRQAEDRAYRLGQKRDVRVIKLISEKTIEEDIFKLACTKIAIDRSISSTNQLEEKEVLKTSLKANTQLNKESEIEIVKENGNVDENEIVVQKKLIDSLRKRFLEGE